MQLGRQPGTNNRQGGPATGRRPLAVVGQRPAVASSRWLSVPVTRSQPAVATVLVVIGPDGDDLGDVLAFIIPARRWPADLLSATADVAR